MVYKCSRLLVCMVVVAGAPLIAPENEVPHIAIVPEKIWKIGHASRVRILFAFGNTDMASLRSKLSTGIASLVGILGNHHSTQLKHIDVETHRKCMHMLAGMFKQVRALHDIGTEVDAKDDFVRLVLDENFLRWSWITGIMMETAVMMAAGDEIELQQYLTRIAPFVHAFLHAVFFLDGDGLPLKHGMNNALQALIKLDPVYIAAPWFLRISEAINVPDFTLPICTFTSKDADAKSSLVEHHRVPNISLVEQLRQVMGFQDTAIAAGLLYTLGAMTEELSHGRVIGSPEDLRSICMSPRLITMLHREFLPAPEIRTQVRAYLMSVCGSFFSVDDKCSAIVPLSEMSHQHLPDHGRYPRTISWEKDDIEGLLEAFGELNLYHLNGPLRLPQRPYTRRYYVPVKGSIVSEMLALIFANDSGIFHSSAAGTYSVHTEPLGLLYNVRLRRVGRILAVVLREGNTGNVLSRYLFPHGAPATAVSVFDSLFFGNDDIRNGFYEVFYYGCLERALADSSDVFAMLEHASVWMNVFTRHVLVAWGG